MRTFVKVCAGWLVLLLVACSSPPEEEPRLREGFEPGAQGGQLPEKVVRDASARYGGSMEAEESTSAAHFGAGLSVVLGPVVFEGESVGSGTSDAGRQIREIISQELTAGGGITLADAPEERFVDDSPRPDLARKGIRYVIKGTTTHTESTGAFTVFLRAVATRTGEVAMVTSARESSRDEAARAATGRLMTKLKGGS